MSHLLNYSFRWKRRSVEVVFWPLCFPLLLGLFFTFSLSNIGKAESMEPIKVAVVQETDAHTYFMDFVNGLAEGENPMLIPETMTAEEADEALGKKEIAGVYTAGEELELTAAQNGIETSILQALLKSYLDHEQLVLSVIEKHPENLPLLLEEMKQDYSCLESVTLGGKSLDFSTQFYYALIAMASLYGCFIGLPAVSALQANVGPLGARCCITPTHKGRLIVSELIACFAQHLGNMIVLFLVLKYLYQVELGGSFGMNLLVAAFGALIGVTMGIFVAAVIKGGEGLKVSVMMAISMGGSACAGLMDQTLKSNIDRNLPWLNRLNPAAVITDALYYINIYDDTARMTGKLLVLALMSAVLLFGAFLAVRRERYASL